MRSIFTSFLLIVMGFTNSVFSQRHIINLNGTWEIEESIDAAKVPKKFNHSVKVPGMANQSIPEFRDIDKFCSKEFYPNYIKIPGLVNLNINEDTMKVGFSFQKRNYLWYRKDFIVPKNKGVIILKINKAQFGTAVWINGSKAGEYTGCFTAQYYDITSFVKARGKNEIIIRIGAHPGVLPASVPAGNDFEKHHWTPGIYDDVSLICTNYPYIETVQVASDIHTKEITIQSLIITKPGTKEIAVNYVLKEWGSGKQIVSEQQVLNKDLSDRMQITHKIKIRDAHLWSPDHPFLYTIELSTGSDNIITRFGMREFRFDTPTKRAYLNDTIIFLRGSNITLHRFFDDSLCKDHPWDEQWVRKLLIELPEKYHWNSFRFCIGPVPEKWFDIADEAGLLIQNEYFIWSYRPYWDSNILKNQITDWMRDCWNHPSVAWWDINNETREEPILRNIINEVRSLDLSNRAWDDGYNLPEGDNDPVEDHNYRLFHYNDSSEKWTLHDFENTTSEKSKNSPHPTAHACVLNEYGWLWLKRTGQYTSLTANIYNHIAEGYSNTQRQELYAYLIACETEYFRAHRNYAGVLHFCYLTGDFYGSLTGDIFQNPEKLEPVPIYDEYFSEIFKPLGVYVNFFPEEVKASSGSDVAVMLVNDEYHKIKGSINMQLYNSKGDQVAEAKTPFNIGELSQRTCLLNFQFPSEPGEYWLKTYAVQESGEKTLCKRKIYITTNYK